MVIRAHFTVYSVVMRGEFDLSHLSEKGLKGRKFIFCAREAPKSHRRRKRKGEKERAKRRKVGDEKKAVVARLVFIMATLAEKNTL